MARDSMGRLPNPELGAVALLQQRLGRAVLHVGTSLNPGKQRIPSVLVERDGGLPIEDLTRFDRARLLCHTRAESREHAFLVAASVRNVWVPTQKVVGGVYETLTYRDPASGEVVTITFGHAREDGGPRYIPDSRGVPMVTEPFLVIYS